MSDNIKIDIEQLNKDLQTLAQCIKDFEPYSKGFIENTREVFNEFNSDFISKMDSVIKHLSDDIAGDILDNVNDIYDKTQGIVTAFKEFDETVLNKLK